MLDNLDGITFIARDRAGEKPLYYLKDEDRFIFGSELQTILNFLTTENSMSML